MSLVLENIGLQYGEEILLKNANAQLEKGMLCALLGKNGTGKTTLLKAIINLNSFTQGQVLIDDKVNADYSGNELSQKVSVVFSGMKNSIGITARDFILHGRYPYQSLHLKKEALNLYEKELLENVIENLALSNELNRPISELSDGNFQKVSIARAMVQDTPIILLDEPLSHLDVANQQMILEILRELAFQEKKIVLFSTHDWQQSLNIANQVWLIQDRKLWSGFTEDIAVRSHLISNFGSEAYHFDYQINQYLYGKSSHHEINKQVRIESDFSEKRYWVEKALVRNGIEIGENARSQIEIRDEEMLLKEEEQTQSFDSIEQLIQYLKK